MAEDDVAALVVDNGSGMCKAADTINTVFQRWLCMMAKQCAEHQDGDPNEHLSWVCCSPLTGIDE